MPEGKEDKNGTGAGDGGQESGDTLTQEQVNRIVGERLAREREKFADYDALKDKAGKLDELLEAKKSDEERLNERIAAAENKAAETATALEKAQHEALVMKVANSKKLPEALADRLVGKTQEELEADADRILEAVKAQGPKPPPTRQPKQKQSSKGDASNGGEENDGRDGSNQAINDWIRQQATANRS